MIRIEIFANHSTEAELFEAFSQRNVLQHYTKIPSAHGIGNSDPKMGDHIWPEENFILIVYCSQEEAALVEEAVAEVKENFPNEGIKIFTMTG